MTPSAARNGDRKTIPVLAAVASAVAVPFVGTGLFRLYLPEALVALLLLGAAAALAAVPRYGQWLSVGWVVGLAAYTAFLLWLFSSFTTPP